MKKKYIKSYATHSNLFPSQIYFVLKNSQLNAYSVFFNKLLITFFSSAFPHRTFT